MPTREVRRGVARELGLRSEELGRIIQDTEQLGQEYTERRDEYQQFQNEAVRAQMEMGVSGGPPEIQKWERTSKASSRISRLRKFGSVSNQ